MQDEKESAASPLAVIVVIAMVAAGLTALVFFVTVDVSGPALALQQVEGPGGSPAWQVTEEEGGLSWEALRVEFLDPSGADRAGAYLHVPAGDVKVGQQVTLRSGLPGGTYLLRILDGDREILRLAAVV